MTLKKLNFLIFPIILLILINCNNDEKNKFYEIKANITGVKENSKVVLFSYEENKVIDSTIIKNGKFTFNGKIEYPFTAGVSIDDDRLFLQFWVENGKILIKTDKQTIKKFQGNYIEAVKGNEINPLNLRYIKFLKPSQDKKALKYMEMKKGIISEKEFQAQIDTIYGLVYNFFSKKSNADNYLSLSEIINYKEGIPKKDLNNYYSKLSKNLKESPKGKALYNYIKYSGVIVGEVAPDITAKDIKGQEIFLKDYRGNYILLDFWASWCKPCIEEIKTKLPILKSKYENENFKIVSFSFDVDSKSWIKSSSELNIDWINVSDNISLGKSLVAFKYGVNSIPSRFLIDPNGNIIKIFNQNDDLLLEIEKFIGL